MMKWFAISLMLYATLTEANSLTSFAEEQKRLVMKHLKSTHPDTLINGASKTPPVATINVDDGHDPLPEMGIAVAGKETMSKFVTDQFLQRPKYTGDSIDNTTKLAESLLNQNSGCHIVHAESSNKVFCPAELPCASGDCDKSIHESSSDLNEGLGKLGAISNAAQEVTITQAGEHQAKLFSGNAQFCKQYPLGSNDCCSGKGWGKWVLHCPRELQALQRAKEEHRVVFLGKKGSLLGTKYAYCVFPTKLSALIQIEGRWRQLHIPFGGYQQPNCRGLSSAELEHINFDKLPLESLGQEWSLKKTLPDNSAMIQRMTQQINALHASGARYE